MFMRLDKPESLTFISNAGLMTSTVCVHAEDAQDLAHNTDIFIANAVVDSYEVEASRLS